jgi:hypothetical protein
MYKHSKECLFIKEDVVRSNIGEVDNFKKSSYLFNFFERTLLHIEDTWKLIFHVTVYEFIFDVTNLFFFVLLCSLLEKEVILVFIIEQNLILILFIYDFNILLLFFN